ncbi:TetR family transcriptional regulator [Devosia algicola]|uniref:TetR family transcriptional regulator n=1 Tax=Devosia algicola TaxID=3026418 RepID=A0ABY7YKD2_9HYPH|nr:TetR family transcriptional regulator [Devosia algicola]WDR01754.1 TetR family transcriptional regulator [Devosia algicola]
MSKAAKTRERIIETAREQFSDAGYDRVTVRDIAAGAGCDPALIIRYFGSKDSLFAEAAQFDLHLPDLSTVAHQILGRALATHFCAIWEQDSGASGFPVLLRSAASNEIAAQKMRQIFAAQVLPALKPVVRRENLELTAALISSQLLGIALGRYILKLPPLVALSRQETHIPCRTGHSSQLPTARRLAGWPSAHATTLGNRVVVGVPSTNRC